MLSIDIKKYDKNSYLKEKEISLHPPLNTYACFCQKHYKTESILKQHLNIKHFEYAQKIKNINLRKLMIKQKLHQGIQFARLVELNDNTLQRINNNELIKMDNFNSDSTVFAFESKIINEFPFKQKWRFIQNSKKTKQQNSQMQKNRVAYFCFCGYSHPKILFLKYHLIKMHLPSKFQKINFFRLNNLLTQQKNQKGQSNYQLNSQINQMKFKLGKEDKQIDYLLQQAYNEIFDGIYKSKNQNPNYTLNLESLYILQININNIVRQMATKFNKKSSFWNKNNFQFINKDQHSSFQKLEPANN